MSQQIVIAEEARIAALLTDDRVDELIVAQGQYQIGDIFLGTVENVLPGIDAAFIDIGESDKNGFIHVSDLGPLKIKQGAAGITELLEPKQKVLVQVMKEPTGSKGPRLTGNIALPGKYLVLQPFGEGVNISRKINVEKERSRLKALGILIKPPSTGLLFRTESEKISEEYLIEDLENLISKWESILQMSETSNPPSLIQRDEDFSLRILRDHVDSTTNKIFIDNKNAVDRAKSFLPEEESHLIIEFHNNSKNEHILEKYKINQTIQKALEPRVDLPSGGYIIIEPTEALTVIDVNSGSFTRSANSRQTVLWTNCEAAIEISRQMKLRNIGGVLVIDFIDMESRRDQFQLLEHFTNAIKDDSARPQIAQLTELGLVELTRKRQGQNIYELFSTQCDCCKGLGHIQKLPTFKKDIKEQKKSLKKTKKIIHEGSKETIQNEVYEKQGNNINIETSELNSFSEAEPKTNKKRDISYSSHSANEKELIPIHLTENEKIVYSQLGINPLIKYGKDQFKPNFIAQIEFANTEKENKSNKKKAEINTKIEKTDFEIATNNPVVNIATDEPTQNSSEKEINLTETLDEIPNNDEPDASRRKRRRSSASGE
tara:strand:+ start:1901 stop:3706 length:1806 start_codon:yes stop_codon:yes gene_type:complete